MIIETTIQKWGNGLALRVAGVMREIPGFSDGTAVTVEITEDGFLVKKAEHPRKAKIKWPVTEEELIADLDNNYGKNLLVEYFLDSEIPDYDGKS